jgi:Domain of unknown function (DUF1833)
MSNYTEFYLKSKANIVQLELLEISHPSFTQVYRVVRNAINGVTVTLEDTTVRLFTYYPLRISLGSSRDNLDTSLKIDLGDLGQVLPKELDAVASAGNYSVKPIVKYRTYRSDDLTAPLYGPVQLEIGNFNFNRTGSSFEAKAPSLNISRTGETYKLERFPMLRGFL